jgi:hypothetical protein
MLRPHRGLGPHQTLEALLGPGLLEGLMKGGGLGQGLGPGLGADKTC